MYAADRQCLHLVVLGTQVKLTCTAEMHALWKTESSDCQCCWFCQLLPPPSTPSFVTNIHESATLMHATSTCLGSNTSCWQYQTQADVQQVDTTGLMSYFWCAWCSLVSGAGAVQWAGGGHPRQPQEPAEGSQGAGMQSCYMPCLLASASHSRWMVTYLPCCGPFLTGILTRETSITKHPRHI